MNYNEKITENFSWFELFKSETAIRNNIDNYSKDEKILNNLKDLTVNILQPIRDYFGPIKVNSGYRCMKLNTLIGSSKSSNHLHGYAADIEPWDSSIKLIEIVKWIYSNLPYRELICEFFPDGWIHVAYIKNNNNYQLKLKDKKHNYSRMTIEEILKIYE